MTRLQDTARSPQQSTTRENMAHALSVNTIINSFPSPTLPKHTGKPDYLSIQDMHHILTANTASIESPRGEGQNGHPRLVLTAT